MVRIITLKQQNFSQSDPVLIRQFKKKLQSDAVLSGLNWLQSWSSPIQSWSVLISGTSSKCSFVYRFCRVSLYYEPRI